MKKLKIFALPSFSFKERTSGVDFLRVIQPLKHLNGYKDDTYEYEVKVFDARTDMSFDWRDVFEKYDIVFFNYTTKDVGYAIMGLMAQKYKKKLVLDIDDALHEILSDNPAFEVYKKGTFAREVVTAILRDVHHVTCTNSHLKHSLAQNAGIPQSKITVIPNYIDLNIYKHRCEFKDRGYYKAVHFGSSTHFASFYSETFVEAMNRIMLEYPNFTFRTIGAFVPSFRAKWGVRYEQGFGDSDIYKWIDKMPEIMDDSDFMLVPLINNSYNRSKSSTKFLEASSYKIPGIYQDIRQYQELIKNGENGFLASTVDTWYSSIKTMLDNAEKRKSMGEGAFKTIQDWTIQGNVKRYADMFKDYLTFEK